MPGNRPYWVGGSRAAENERAARKRATVHYVVMGDMLATGAVFTLTGIDRLARNAWENTWKPARPGPFPQGDWPWLDLHDKHCRDPWCYQTAVWSAYEGGASLVGLGIGEVSRKRDALEVYYLEAAPFPTRPRGVLVPLLAAAEGWAQALQIPAVRLMDPVPRVATVYTGVYGYTLVQPPAAATFCEKRV